MGNCRDCKHFTDERPSPSYGLPVFNIDATPPDHDDGSRRCARFPAFFTGGGWTHDPPAPPGALAETLGGVGDSRFSVKPDFGCVQFEPKGTS